MAIDWLAVRADPIRAIEHGVDATDHFETTFTGDQTFSNIDYPAAQVYPVVSSRSGGNEWSHTIEANLIFQRQRRQDYVDDILHPMADVIDESLAALSDTESVVAYYPAEMEDFVGELDGTGVIIVRVQFETTTLVEMADTAPE